MKDEKSKDLTLDVDKNKDLVEDKGLEKGVDPEKMTAREKAEKEHDDIDDAPESGTVIQEENPSRPSNAKMTDQPDDYGEAPESGTIRES